MAVPRPSSPYHVRIVDADSRDLPTYWHEGRTYVMGTVGTRYSIVVSNPTSRRVEAVVSVDGLDAIDGHTASYIDHRGYILQPYGSATIDGFRTSLSEVATFRFSSVADSYAGRLGQARDVGVIGVAFFPEREPLIVRQPPPRPYEYPRPHPAAPRAASAAPAPTASRIGEGDLAPAERAPAPATANADSVTDITHAGGPLARRAADEAKKVEDRPGLGTEFGEARESHVNTTDFERANPRSPSQVVAIRYNDRAGLIALGIVIPTPPRYVDSEVGLRETASPFRETRFAQPPP